MATIDRRPNGKWRARYRLHAGGRQRAKPFERKIDAERFLTRLQGQVLDGSYVDPSAGQVSVGQFAGSWQTEQVHRPTTVAQVDAHLPLIFTNANGAPIRRNRFNELLRPATTRAGIEGLRSHDLRHFSASLLIAHGESVKVVQARLGHASASETLDTCAHLWPGNEERTRAAVDEILGGARETTTRFNERKPVP